MKIYQILSGALLFFTISAQATPQLHRLAYRSPNETWQDAYQRSLQNYEKIFRQMPAEKNAQEAAVKIDKLDPNLVNVWGKSVDSLTSFMNVRDIRFLQTEDDPSFLRRISWQYPDDGCFARAAMAVNRFREWNIQEPSKVFIFGNLKVNTKNSPEGNVTWWYHVAPVVRVGNFVYVLDPAIEPYNPILLLDWVKTMTNDPMRVKLAFCKPNSYSPSDNCYNPGENDANDAPSDQLYYLNKEWTRAENLGRDPKLVLGDEPPWKNPR